jgi:asparagine synthase (glutamine-hydrolysing)
LTGCDERHISDGIVRHYGLPMTNVWADTFWPLKGYPAHGPDRDDPFIWPYQALIEHTLATARSEGMGLMLSGDRGDEMVGDWIFDFDGLLRSRQWPLLWAELQAYSQRNSLPVIKVIKHHLFRPYLLKFWPQGGTSGLRRSNHRKQLRAPYADWVRPEFARQVKLAEIIADSVAQPQVTDVTGRQRYQRVFMFAGMRIAMLNERSRARFGLEFADPWSDRRMASYVLAVPQWVIQQVREPKRVARRAMRGIMPEAARQNACKIIPGSLFDRGFIDRAKDTVQGLITDSQAAARGYLDEETLRACYESFLRGEPQRYDFWWPLTLEMWLRQYWS